MCSSDLVAVLADAPRPFRQGARLTAWELVKDGIETTVITDNMAGTMMRLGNVDLVVVGADRIAANGDVANKIGTYGVAVLAAHHGIPFIVCAPSSNILRHRNLRARLQHEVLDPQPWRPLGPVWCHHPLRPPSRETVALGTPCFSCCPTSGPFIV